MPRYMQKGEAEKAIKDIVDDFNKLHANRHEVVTQDYYYASRALLTSMEFVKLARELSESGTVSPPVSTAE